MHHWRWISLSMSGWFVFCTLSSKQWFSIWCSRAQCIIFGRFTEASTAEHELYVDLMDGYNDLERPVSNGSKPVVVYLGIVLQQLIDVVGNPLPDWTAHYFLRKFIIRDLRPVMVFSEWSRADNYNERLAELCKFNCVSKPVLTKSFWHHHRIGTTTSWFGIRKSMRASATYDFLPISCGNPTFCFITGKLK